MRGGAIARRYGKAMFLIGEERGDVPVLLLLSSLMIGGLGLIADMISRRH